MPPSGDTDSRSKPGTHEAAPNPAKNGIAREKQDGKLISIIVISSDEEDEEDDSLNEIELEYETEAGSRKQSRGVGPDAQQ